MRRFLIQTLFCLLMAVGNTQNLEKIAVPDFDGFIDIPIFLPEQYDLRGTGRLGEVKIQPNGGCWSSAAMGSVESVWRTFGYSGETLSDINLKLFHGFLPERSSYGNHYMATAYFTRGSGPLFKNPENDSVLKQLPPIVNYITDARYLPNNHELIKKTIMGFGAVYSMIFFKKKDLDTSTNVYYTRTRSINHAVILTGWNDTLITKKGKGVWIAQNSLGAKFGDKGFFYIPYQDPNILEYNAIWPHWIPFDEAARIYYYDTLGSYHSYGFRDTICYGLVKFVAENDITLTRVSSHINFAGTRIQSWIYDCFDTSAKAPAGLLGQSSELHCNLAGYYTFGLEKPVNINMGDDFYIMMRYITPNDTLPLPVETYVQGYSDPHITSKKCWINPDHVKWPSTWYECGTESTYTTLNFDLCIRVYTILRRE